MILLVALLACSGGRATPPKTTGAEEPTELVSAKGLYHLRWRAAGPVVMGELFSVETTLLDAQGQPVEQGSVQVDARMPQHGHGMTTRPVADPGNCTAGICRHPNGIYRMDGMKFHMQGEWTLTFAVDGPAGPDKAEARYAL